MKHRFNKFFLLAGMFAVLVLTGCRSMKRVSAEKFMATANRIGEPPVNTLLDPIQIIGITQDRAYLEYRPAITCGPGVKVYWVPLSELPDDVQAALKKKEYPKPVYHLKIEDVEIMPAKKEYQHAEEVLRSLNH